MQVNRRLLSFIPLVILCGAGSNATAQSVDAQNAGALEEIIVSARKRPESLQDTPLSIQAFTQEGLELRNITNVAEVGAHTPNMVFDRAAAIAGSNSSAVVYIRGIGQDASIPTIDLGVGTYLDGVYLARSVGGVFDLIDVERVEIIRGPQGTLFGRNTIGGAINIVSRRPSQEFYADAELDLGTDSLFQARFNANGGLTDSLAASAAVMATQRDGYVTRPDGTDMGNEDSVSGRIAFAWDISDRATLDIAVDGTHSDSNGAPFTLVDVNRDAPFPTFHNAFMVPPAEGCFVPPPFGTGSTSNPNPLCYNENYIPEDTTTDYGTVPPKDELDLFGIAATLTFDLTENVALKSITSYRDTESEFALDQDHSPLTIAHVNSTSTQDQFTQEFQLLGTTLGGRLSYIAGVYYFAEESEYLEDVTFSPTMFRSGGSNDNDSKAVFAQLTYDFTDALSVTAGLRYTEDTKRFTPDQVIYSNNNDAVPLPLLGFGPGQVPPVPPPGTRILPFIEETIEIEEATPMVNLSYHWTDSLMTYVTYSEGFKSGGFTQRVFPPQPDVPSFKPEFADVIEFGFKYQSANNRLRLNGAWFSTDYEDLQIVSQAQTVAPLVLNAGGAEISGFELDLQALPGDGWLLELSAGFLDAEYTRVDVGTGITTDNKLVKTPELSAAAAASYTYDFAGGSALTSRVDYMHQADSFNNAINSAPLWQEDFDLLNLSFAYESAGGQWRVTAYGKNLGDEEYISAGYSEQNGPTLNLGTSEMVRDRGRIFGLRISYRMD